MVKSQFKLVDKVNWGEADECRALCPHREQTDSQPCSDMVHETFQSWTCAGNPEG